MKKSKWLPDNYSIEESTITDVILTKDKWQLYDTNSSSMLFLFNDKLKNIIDTCGILAGALIKEIEVDKKKYFYFFLKKDSFVGNSIDYKNVFFRKKSDYQAIAISLRETRKIIKDYSLSNSIYIEQLSIFVPEELILSNNDDDRFLGEWLTGGVRTSVYNQERMLSVIPNLNKKDLHNLICLSGLKQTESSTTALKKTSFQSKFFLPGRKELTKFFNDYVVDIVSNEDKYKKFGIDFPKGIILYGLPGTGKTYAVQKLVDYLEWPCFFIDSESVASPYIHQSSKKISDLFDRAIKNAPSVLVIDEMETYLSSREESNQNYHIEEVSEFLRRIPEANSKKVLIIGLTNFIEKIDKAILRKGRFDHQLELKFPDETELKEVVDAFLSKIPHDKPLDLTNLYKKLANKPISDIDFVLRQSAIIAAKKDKDYIDKQCIEQALTEISEVNLRTSKVGFL